MNLMTSAMLCALIAGSVATSWLLRFVIRALTRRAVRLGQQRPGVWRVRLARKAEVAADGESRRRQRADAAARMLGHIVTSVIFVGAVFAGLQLLGVDPVYVISSAGFVGLAIALSGQEIIRNLLTGTLALLEDRYAVGDDVMLTIAGTEVRGIIDIVGPASVRLRTPEGAAWHAGHAAIDSITNYSQMPATVDIVVPTDEWNDVSASASKVLAAASNDVGLTGVVFLPDLIEMPHHTGVTTVTISTNKPLTQAQQHRLHGRLLQPVQHD